MLRFDVRSTKNILAVAGGLLLIVGCTSSDSFVQSVRPVYQAKGDVTETVDKSNYALGKKYFSKGQYGLALGAFQNELKQNRRSVQALNGIAACYDQLKRYDLALNYYYKALQIEPDSAQTLGNLGYSYLLQERYQEAERMLKLALHHDPDNDRVKQHLASIDGKYSPSTEVASPSLPTQPEVVAAPVKESAEPIILPTPEAESAEPKVEVVAVEAMDQPQAVAEPALESETAAPAQPESMAQAEVSRADEQEQPVASQCVESDMPSKGDKGLIQGIAGLFKSLGSKIAGLFGSEKSTETVDAVAKSDVESAPVPASSPVVTEKVTADVQEPDNAIEEREQLVAEQSPETKVIPVQPAEAVVEAKIAPQPAEEAAIVETAIQPAAEARAPTPTEAVVVESAPVETGHGKARIEVSNGNGTPGNANLLAVYLKSQGERIWRITNAESFDHQYSVIFYRPGDKLAAQRLANRLPVEVELQESGKNYPGIAARLVIGQELVPYRAEIEKALKKQQRGELYASNYSFGSDSNIAVAIEVSNGNGSEGMARLLRDVLAKKGRLITRVTNARSFDHDTTVIYYQPGELDGASQVAAELPVEVRLEEADISNRNVKLRIIMGRDFIHFKAAMQLLVDKDA